MHSYRTSAEACIKSQLLSLYIANLHLIKYETNTPDISYYLSYRHHRVQ
jgi:hypothetical protein